MTQRHRRRLVQAWYWPDLRAWRGRRSRVRSPEAFLSLAAIQARSARDRRAAGMRCCRLFRIARWRPLVADI